MRFFYVIDGQRCPCLDSHMNNENETPMQQDIDDTLDFDDTDALRYVLKNTKGIAPVSVYREADYLAEDDE